jgi:hypothetical protein
MYLRQQWLWNALRALDFVGGGLDRRAQGVRTGDGVARGWGQIVHAALAARGLADVNFRHGRSNISAQTEVFAVDECAAVLVHSAYEDSDHL